MDNKIWDVIIIGSGPAGCSAAVYASRACLSTLVFDGTKQPGGQLTTTTHVENYLGMDKAQGFDMTEVFRKHAEEYGAQFIKDDAKKIVECHGETKESIKLFKIITPTTSYMTKSVIVASGASAKKLTFPAVDKYFNRGISACATCDGALPMFRNKPIVVVGGGDTACEEALFLSRYGSTIYLVIRGSKMRASAVMKKRVESNPKIKCLYNTNVIDCCGVSLDYGHAGTNNNDINNGDEDYLAWVKCQTPSQTFDLQASGLFFGIGHSPNTDFVNGLVQLDDNGYIVLPTKSTSTSVHGIFAAGDCADKVYRQAITSAGSGAAAAIDCVKYLESND